MANHGAWFVLIIIVTTLQTAVYTEWNDWGPWNACSVTCGDGFSKRHRTCTILSQKMFGHYCIGDPVDFNVCHEQDCGNASNGITNCDLVNMATGICSQQEQVRKFCAKFCGLCPIVSVVAQWGAWTSWSMCTTSCDNGTWTRTRSCSNPPAANGGKHCVGRSTETGFCNIHPCPVDGQWSVWSSWSMCSASCGNGTWTRTRSCSNPLPANGGDQCMGTSTDSGICNVNPCPAQPKTPRYFGCYMDTVTRDLSGTTIEFSDNTPEKCIEFCSNKGYLYAAVQFARHCFCGNTHGRYGPRPESSCNMACPGNANKMCGGSWSNNIYSTEHTQ